MAVVMALHAILCCLLGGTFVALKAFDLLDWSWWTVVMPFSLPSISVAILLVGPTVADLVVWAARGIRSAAR